MNAPADPLAGWVPFDLTDKSGQPMVVWGYVGQERFVDPFFDGTVQYLLRRPFNHVFRRQSGFDHLLQRAEAHPGLPLKGLIFHSGRCGSTLAAQALAALSDSVVLSEPESLNILLKWLIALPAGAENDALSGQALRALLAALGQPRRAVDSRLFLKGACWHVAQIDRLLAAFPGTPWVFIYRDPVETLVSQRRGPDPQLLTGGLFQAGFMPTEEDLACPIGLTYAARLTGHALSAAALAMGRHPGGLLINHRELPGALEARVAEHFGLGLDETDRGALRARAGRDAKKPELAFKDDSAAKRAEADDALRALVARWLAEPYETLERLRGAGA